VAVRPLGSCCMASRCKWLSASPIAESGATPINQSSLHALRGVDGPIQGLHTSDGAAQKPAAAAESPLNPKAEPAPERCHGWKPAGNPARRCGLFRGPPNPGPVEAVAGAQHIDADDEVVIQGEHRAGAKISGHQEPTSAEPESAWQTSTALSRPRSGRPYTA